jgi:hypothetical protein
MDRQRLYGTVGMTAFALVAIYMLYSGVSGLADLSRAVAQEAPAVVAYSGDVIVVPGAMVVLVFAFLEIVRPTEPWHSRLVASALGFFVLTVLLPVGVRLAEAPLLSQRGYTRCAGRVTGYTMPAVQYARDRRHCSRELSAL